MFELKFCLNIGSIFHQGGQSIIFSLDADQLFLNILKFVLIVEFWILIAHNLQKCSQYWHISIFQLIPLEITALDFSMNIWIDGVIFLHDSFLEWSLSLFFILESW